jgi:tetraacyldisaccharide 4'-kinase
MAPPTPAAATAAASPIGPRAALETWLGQQWQQPRPTLAMRALQPLSWLYGALAGVAERRALQRAQAAPVPVIVVGNLVAGGGGKTPTVIAVVQRLRAAGHHPGVISRGHGRQGDGVLAVGTKSTAQQVGDEPLLIHRRTGAPVVVGADRLAAARALCAAHPTVSVLVSDDGLQHHRLRRDAQVIVFDDRGAGNGLLLPAGPLRQQLPAVLPADTVVLYTGGRASTPLPGCIGTRRLATVQPLADWWAGVPTPADGFAALHARPLLAAAALARPEPFFAMLEGQGLRIDRLPLPDHHPLQPPPWPADTTDLIVTEKDAVKLPPGQAGATRVWVAALDFQPEPAFDAVLQRWADRWPRPSTAALPPTP